MAIGTAQIGVPIRLTASGAVAGNGTALSGAQSEASGTASQGAILGFFVSSSTSGTVKLTNISGGAAGSTILLNTTAAITAPAYFPCPISSPNGIWATLGGTIDVTFIVATS